MISANRVTFIIELIMAFPAGVTVLGQDVSLNRLLLPRPHSDHYRIFISIGDFLLTLWEL
jgi:hypothetical protein